MAARHAACEGKQPPIPADEDLLVILRGVVRPPASDGQKSMRHMRQKQMASSVRRNESAGYSHKGRVFSWVVDHWRWAGYADPRMERRQR